MYKEKTSLASSMESRNMGIAVPLGMLMLMLLLGLSSSDSAQDRAECTDQLVGLATCLPYVGGDAAAPTPDCCSGMRLVLRKSLKCLCILVKDRNDPSLGLKVNTTLALSLPASCHAPVNVSQCTELLHLAPNSTDAEVFDGFEKSLEKRNSTSLSNEGNSTDGTAGSSAQIKSNSSERSRKPWLATSTVVSIVLLQTFAGLHLRFISM
ncbi:non-specific lipid transfer protein GPI-anchored 6-like isoform X2 [Rhodamnia argentea]|uniref:Non-specific lipid transfer protein GPI-anchored 6-like isoform X2 n=1 Tax=Rhodamnia argentea TaxID=178133 RepID=A0ABM3HKR2_9MYRT|nr:non-specific lipid transfer protein GPI-anchored 6-like isoform X2 [Rhodamnia argentea]